MGKDTGGRPRWRRQLVIGLVLIAAVGIAASLFVKGGGVVDRFLPWVPEIAIAVLFGILIGRARGLTQFFLSLALGAYIALQVLVYAEYAQIPLVAEGLKVTPAAGWNKIFLEKIPPAGGFLLGYILGLVRA